MILDDPFDDPPGLAEHIPDRSPEPTKEQLEVAFLWSSRFAVLHSHAVPSVVFLHTNMRVMFSE